MIINRVPVTDHSYGCASFFTHGTVITIIRSLGLPTIFCIKMKKNLQRYLTFDDLHTQVIELHF